MATTTTTASTAGSISSGYYAISKTAPALAPTLPAGSPVIMTPHVYRNVKFVVVGAGGTGGRVIPAMAKMLRPGDSIAVVDDDTVEDRNLLRQHFTARDVGMYKALVMASRYSTPDRQITAFAQKFDGSYDQIRSFLGDASSGAIVLIGCSDNAAARIAMKSACTFWQGSVGSPIAWIDAGNDLRGGQVMLTFHDWQMTIAGLGRVARTSLRGLELAMPQLLTPDPPDQVACGAQVDLQTVQVNHMAATAVINQAAMFLVGLPFSSAGCFFSTFNSMTPIKIGKELGPPNGSRREWAPELTYAIAPEVVAFDNTKAATK